MMYSVMIVDNEKTIRDNLKLAVDFEAYGFYVSVTAGNGEEAYEKLCTQKVDLILLDINMPVLNGIGFLEKVAGTAYEAIPVIILSGYSDFAYAREAMKYGVKFYLTKPVDEDEVYGILEGIKKELDENKEHLTQQQLQDDRERLARNYNTRTPVEGFCAYNIVTVIVVAQHNTDKTVYEILQITSMQLLGRARVLNKGYLYAYLLPDERLGEYTSHAVFCEAFKKKLEEQGVSARVFINTTLLEQDVVDFTEKYDAYVEQIVTTVFYEGIASQEAIRVKNSGLDSKVFDNHIVAIREKLILNEKDKLMQVVEKLFEEIKKNVYRIVDIGVLTDRLFYLCMNILAIEGQSSQSKELKLVDVRTVSVCMRYNEWCEAIVQLFEDTLGILDEGRAFSQMGVYGEIIEYVKQNYHHPITIKQVSDKFFVNSTYLGRVFQKTVGKSFKQYVTELRMAHAKVLLVQSNKKVYEIASEVGYVESKYFIAKFTQEMGKSPAEYRKSRVYKK